MDELVSCGVVFILILSALICAIGFVLGRRGITSLEEANKKLNERNGWLRENITTLKQTTERLNQRINDLIAKVVRLENSRVTIREADPFPAVSRQREWELRNMPYREYLQTHEWMTRAKIMRNRFQSRCQICNRTGGGRLLEVHHRDPYYDTRGIEKPIDLTVLCHECHDLFHRHGRIR